MFEKILKHFGYKKIKPKKLLSLPQIDAKIIKSKGKWSPEAKRHARNLKKANKWRKEHIMEILQKKHAKKLPKVHFDDCPACNPQSQTSLKDYISKVRVVVRQHATTARLIKKTNSLLIDHTQDDVALTIEGIPAKDFDTHERPIIMPEETPEPKGGYVI